MIAMYLNPTQMKAFKHLIGFNSPKVIKVAKKQVSKQSKKQTKKGQ